LPAPEPSPPRERRAYTSRRGNICTKHITKMGSTGTPLGPSLPPSAVRSTGPRPGGLLGGARGPGLIHPALRGDTFAPHLGVGLPRLGGFWPKFRGCLTRPAVTPSGITLAW
jgi:hypothetical protein